jgi:hypothetical protein
LYLSSQGLASAIQASFIGATEAPSPVTSVVIPCRTLDSTRLSTKRFISDWPSMSMKPGATMLPAASTFRAALAAERSPRAASRSPRMPTSARNQGAPVPSTTRPLAITRS